MTSSVDSPSQIVSVYPTSSRAPPDSIRQEVAEIATTRLNLARGLRLGNGMGTVSPAMLAQGLNALFGAIAIGVSSSVPFIAEKVVWLIPSLTPLNRRLARTSSMYYCTSASSRHSLACCKWMEK